MMKRKALYTLLACASILFIFYALTQNYIIDPGAETFLSHKTGLKRELNLPAWLNVMYVHVAFACIAMAAACLIFRIACSKKAADSIASTATFIFYPCSLSC